MDLEAVVQLRPKSLQEGISTSPRPPPRVSSSARSAQCTHMTMTRIYNPDFRCGLCLRDGEFGWLYRCTQDRELAIQDDFEKGRLSSFDQLSSLFPLPSEPQKRSPAARSQTELSFFDEVNEEQLRSYSPEQIEVILKQRAHVTETIKQVEPLIDFSHGLQILSMPSVSSPVPVLSPPPGLRSPQKKPWILINECQFKVCHRCRWHSADRAWLSLNGVADDDLPPTAITGFGFHLQGKRPIALVEHAKNLGLRNNPPTTPNSKMYLSPPQSPVTPGSALRSPKMPTQPPNPFNDENSIDTTFGQDSNAYDSASMTRKLNAEHGPLQASEGGTNPCIPLVKAAFDIAKDSVYTEIKDASKHISTAVYVRPPWTPPVSPTMKPVTDAGKEVWDQKVDGTYGRSCQSLKTNLSLRTLFNLDSLVSHDSDVGLFLPLNSFLLDRASAIPLPPATPGEILDNQQVGHLEHHASMKLAEFGNAFTSEPLKVPDGLAVTEEAVQQNFADVVTGI